MSLKTNSETVNFESEMALEYLVHTNKSVFLTGKAGTGKTTFLKNLKLHTPKRIVISAPTGVAAINAGGVTLHSLFQLAFSPFIPNQFNQSYDKSQSFAGKRFSKDKIDLLKSMDILVIDEISMVRCDVMDAIDAVLRRFRNRQKPFGGVQLLLIGDTHQLAPVIKDFEWEILRPYYKSIFFFSSLALKENFPVTIELKQIYRQTDSEFINLLNKIRNHKPDAETFEILNKRLNPTIVNQEESKGYITLTTHNQTAKEINSTHLERIDSFPYIFHAEIKDDFPPYSFPTDEVLELKIGAQVMFIKNDGNKEKQYFNGKIGQIIDIEEDIISIKTDEHDEIKVSKETWQNIKYTLNPDTKNIDEVVLGEFRQIPLKLAYAITIHKSQGLTFDKVIIDAKAAFSSGQVYVALSRCRTLEGIVLSTRIGTESLMPNYEILDFNKQVSENVLSENQLELEKKQYQKSLLEELLDYNKILRPLMKFSRLVAENTPPLNANLKLNIEKLLLPFQEQIATVMFNFKKQIASLIEIQDPFERQSKLAERLSKSAVYFELKLEEILINPLKEVFIETDNKTTKTLLEQNLESLNRAIFIQHRCFQYCKNDFSTYGFVEAKVNAEMEFDEVKTVYKKALKIRVSSDVLHPDLYIKLKELRRNLANEKNQPEYMIFNNKAIHGIANLLPLDHKSLENVSGIGKISSEKYGEQIIKMVSAYCEETNAIPAAIEYEEKKGKMKRGGTAKLSLELYLNGKSIQEIAQERTLQEGTIHSHLARFVATGAIDIRKVLTEEKQRIIEKAYAKDPKMEISQAKAILDQSIEYRDIRYYLSYRDFILEQKNN